MEQTSTKIEERHVCLASTEPDDLIATATGDQRLATDDCVGLAEDRFLDTLAGRRD